jgi:hypothetical protein
MSINPSIIGLALVAAVVSASPTYAAPKGFAPYEGKNAVTEGEGGTKIQANNIDFWTTGSPPRRYRVLGVLSDSRPARGFASDPTKSRALAERVRSAGGDAAIFLDASTNVNAVVAIGNGIMAPVQERTTRLLVIKYEDQAPAAPAPN